MYIEWTFDDISYYFLSLKARNATEKTFSNVGNISKIMDVHSATRLYCLRKNAQNQWQKTAWARNHVLNAN